jgi:hypothetical protein
MSVLRRDDDLVTWLSDRLLAIAGTVPDFRSRGSGSASPADFSDRRIFDVANYPDSMWKKPGEKAPNRAGLAAWGSYVNSLALRDYGRPLFIAASADLAESTNIAGFGQDFGARRAPAGTSGPRTPPGRCCRRRSPSSPTPGWSPGWPRSTWPRTRLRPSTASGARAPPTARSPT